MSLIDKKDAHTCPLSSCLCLVISQIFLFEGSPKNVWAVSGFVFSSSDNVADNVVAFEDSFAGYC